MEESSLEEEVMGGRAREGQLTPRGLCVFASLYTNSQNWILMADNMLTDHHNSKF